MTVQHKANFGMSISCSCGWLPVPRPPTIDAEVQAFAEHYALELQASKPRARRGGVDESAPTSASHLATLEVIRRNPKSWMSADFVWATQPADSARYSPQRIRTCLAGLVRAGLVEERRRTGRVRQYRLATTTPEETR